MSAAVVALGLLLLLAQRHTETGRWIKEPSKYLQAVDLVAFRNLIDPSEEQYLRDHLPLEEFRVIQKKRLRAAIEYVKAVKGNAAVLLRLGQAARINANPAVATEAEGLVNAALQLRLMSMRALAALYLRIFLPGGQVSLDSIAERYQQITGKMAVFSLRYPLRDVKSVL
ncbi:MAG TPA: hypothetical protein VF753_16810 [Terriglobales bacterium]